METKPAIEKLKKKKPSKKKKAIAEKELKKGLKKITRMKIWMMENGLNQSDVAKNAQISPNTMNRLVNKGKASMSVLKSISNELKISFEELTGLLEFIEPISK